MSSIIIKIALYSAVVFLIGSIINFVLFLIAGSNLKNNNKFISALLLIFITIFELINWIANKIFFIKVIN